MRVVVAEDVMLTREGLLARRSWATVNLHVGGQAPGW